MNRNDERAARKRKRWITRGALLGVFLLGLGLGWLLVPAGEWAYLDLQADSDAVHRFAVLWLPISGVVFLFFWPIGRVFEEFVWVRRVTLAVMAIALAFGAGVASHVLRFDGGIERAGLRGQMLAYSTKVPGIGGSWLLGPYREDDDGPGIATDKLPGGDYLTLDKRRLARRTAADGYRWSRHRDGLWPAMLVVTPVTVLLAMPSGQYPDDITISAVELVSGRGLFDFHCLGNRVSAPVVRGEILAFTIGRPSSSAVYLLNLREIKLAWSRFLPQVTGLPPRLDASWVEVAQGSTILRLAARDGREIGRSQACADPAAARVACRAGQVIAWLNQE